MTSGRTSRVPANTNRNMRSPLPLLLPPARPRPQAVAPSTPGHVRPSTLADRPTHRRHAHLSVAPFHGRSPVTRVYRAGHRTTRREGIVGWIILGLIAVVIAGVVVMVVRQRRSYRARLAAPPPDSWQVARDAFTGGSETQSRA